MDADKQEVCPNCGSEHYEGAFCENCEGERLCPDCGSEGYDGETCEECSIHRLKCPFCGSIVDDSVEQMPCSCAIAWYSYGAGEVFWASPEFEDYCKRHIVRDESTDDDVDTTDEAITLDELRSLAGGWIVERIVGEDGAKGHCNPNVWFFAKTEDQMKYLS